MPTVFNDSFNVTTLLGSQLTLSSILPVNFNLERTFTLNNHLGIYPNAAVNEIPKLHYFGVGIGGCYNVNDGNLQAPFNPARTNMNLYHLIPIRCVPVAEDLTSAERAKYRLRQRATLDDGEEYFLYYLKVLEFSDDITYVRINPSDGTEVPYELDSSNLAPTPNKVSSDSSVIANTSTIVGYYETNIEVNADEILEYIKVHFAGDTRYAAISEIGFFTGVDFDAQGYDGNNVGISYKEAAYTQLYCHTTCNGIPLTHSGMKTSFPFRIATNGIITSL